MDTPDKEKYLKIIKEWLSKQPHLPQNINEALLHRFLHCCNYSVEQAKHLVDLFCTLRSQAPEIFADRDPVSPEMQETFENFDFILSPKPSAQKNKVFMCNIKTPDPAKYHCLNSIKALSIFIDVRLAIEDNLADGEVPIYDMGNYTLKHLTKLNLPVVKKFMAYMQEAYPIRLKQIHLVNVPSFMNKVMRILKPFMKSEVSKMMLTHLPNSETLYDYVPRDLLPTEYGGNIGDIQDLKKWWLEKIMEHRDYINDISKWTVDEAKRPIDSNNSGKKMFGVEGSFRSLAID